MNRREVAQEKVKLLFGPYTAPDLDVGDRAFCLARDRLVVVAGWSDAPTPWPLCRGLGRDGGGAGLLVDDELARAVRSESRLAVCRWWGVSPSTAERWRRALGVGRMDSEGSRRLILGAVEASVVKRGDAPPKLARRRGKGRATEPKDAGVIWTPAEVALVGVLPDVEVAARTGRTLNAVRLKREGLGRPNPEHPGWPYVRWTPEADRLALTLPVRDAAVRTGHTPAAVIARRAKLRATRGNPP